MTVFKNDKNFVRALEFIYTTMDDKIVYKSKITAKCGEPVLENKEIIPIVGDRLFFELVNGEI